MKNFPFTAIVGLEQAKRSLIYHAIDPRIGGVLFTGDRGCAKSTLVRSFADLLQADDQGGRAPFVEVPLGVTEDRLLGSVDPERLTEKGEWSERIGLIEQANGGALYVDEINLFPDQLADCLLDAAATGEYRMERDGICRHTTSRFILVGTMNPDEGDLRPQLSDRFGHTVTIHSDFSVDERIEIVERRLWFEESADSLAEAFESSQRELAGNLDRARSRLHEVRVDREQKRRIAQDAKALELEGLRRELAVIRTARCAAAWAGRTTVADEDIEEAWRLCIGSSTESVADTPQTPQPETRSSSSDSRSAATTPSSPQTAQPDRIPTESQVANARALEDWYSRSTSSLTSNRPSVRGADSPSRRAGQRDDKIDWLESIKASFFYRWARGRHGLILRYACRPRSPRCWVFLDASRSTGMTKFLSHAQGELQSLFQRMKRTRIHLLVLSQGKVNWLVRSGTPKTAEARLTRVKSAEGKSLLAQSVDRVARAMAGTTMTRYDRVLIVTDGLNSPKSGERAENAQHRLRNSLKRLTRFAIPVAWAHPPAKRGLKRWLDRLVAGLSIDRLEI